MSSRLVSIFCVINGSSCANEICVNCFFQINVSIFILSFEIGFTDIKRVRDLITFTVS
ncbi:MAG: hypothetical protein WCG25_02530 [bacterium]